MPQKLWSILFIFSTLMSYTQNMQEGFDYLEQGKFDKAEHFFEDILQDYPSNKTANLCYARAIGLNGKAEAAKNKFATLLTEYPNDLELQLNYAESLLWNKDFDAAKGYYQMLLESHDQNFGVLLGYANTLSNLKEYPEATLYIEKALNTNPGNESAMISKKYIRLGYAYQLSQNQEYEKSLQILNANLNDFNNDKQTLLNKANIFLITKAQDSAIATYRKMAITTNDSIVALNGIAVALQQQKKPKKALKKVTEALLKLSKSNDSTIIKQTKERYVQALIWNKKFKQAKVAIEQLANEYPSANFVLALEAMLGMYTSDFTTSIARYQHILAKDSASFDGNLGIANAYFAANLPDSSLQSLHQTLSYYHNQQDAMMVLEKLNTKYSPYIEEKINYTFDNGDNTAYAANTSIIIPVDYQWVLSAMHNYRKTENTVTRNSATAQNFLLGTTYTLLPKFDLHANIGVSTTNSNIIDYTEPIAHVFMKATLFKKHNMTAGYQREMQSFNAALLAEKIGTNHYYINYNLPTNFNLGWYTQYYYTSQTDTNKRNLLFTSLYYNFLDDPTLKTGINYQYITFKNQVPEIYFSPEKFSAVEIFAEILKNENAIQPKQFFYALNGALGYQYIENDPKQSTYRISGSFGYKFSNRCFLNGYFLHSNIASATAAGFTFSEVGVKLKWYFLSKPIFTVH